MTHVSDLETPFFLEIWNGDSSMDNLSPAFDEYIIETLRALMWVQKDEAHILSYAYSTSRIIENGNSK